MIEPWQERTALLLGTETMSRLTAARVLVVGVGGVGGHAAEMIARAGVGHMTLVDGDDVAESNINRQMVATHSTMGQMKVNVLAPRLRDIHPDIDVTPLVQYLTADDMEQLIMPDGVPAFDFVVDAIDTLTPKIALIKCCMIHNIRIVSSMGAGARLDPSKVEQTDICRTHTDGLARAVRTRLKAEHITQGLPVVFSTELPRAGAVLTADGTEHGKRSTVGSISFLPAVFGCHLAAYVINTLAAETQQAAQEEPSTTTPQTTPQ